MPRRSARPLKLPARARRTCHSARRFVAHADVDTLSSCFASQDEVVRVRQLSECNRAGTNMRLGLLVHPNDKQAPGKVRGGQIVVEKLMDC